MEIIIIFFWLLFCIAAAGYASQKGVSGVGIFFLSLLFSPVVGFIVAACMKPTKTPDSGKQLEQGELEPRYKYEERLRQAALADSEKTCPECAERVKAAATKCRFCQHIFTALVVLLLLAAPMFAQQPAAPPLIGGTGIR